MTAHHRKRRRAFPRAPTAHVLLSFKISMNVISNNGREEESEGHCGPSCCPFYSAKCLGWRESRGLCHSPALGSPVGGPLGSRATPPYLWSLEKARGSSSPPP